MKATEIRHSRYRAARVSSAVLAAITVAAGLSAGCSPTVKAGSNGSTSYHDGATKRAAMIAGKR